MVRIGYLQFLDELWVHVVPWESAFLINPQWFWLDFQGLYFGEMLKKVIRKPLKKTQKTTCTFKAFLIRFFTDSASFLDSFLEFFAYQNASGNQGEQKNRKQVRKKWSPEALGSSGRDLGPKSSLGGRGVQP